MNQTSSSDALSDDALAVQLAARAGDLLLELRRSFSGDDAKVLRDQGDRRSHVFLTEQLALLRPDDPVLSEEGRHDGDRLGSRRVWIVDPLDGTREFGEPPRDDWAVHVALCVEGRPTASAVSLPARGVTLSSASPPVPAAAANGRVRLVVSRTRAPGMVAEIGRALDAEVIPMGSAGAKAMAVAEGRADAYIHAGGQYEWDSAAPAGVCMAAGLHVSRIDGTELVYNQPNPWLPDILVCRSDLAPRLLQLISESAH